jgi:autotransporter passenger strand-loop-strand repeat protein
MDGEALPLLGDVSASDHGAMSGVFVGGGWILTVEAHGTALGLAASGLSTGSSERVASVVDRGLLSGCTLGDAAYLTVVAGGSATAAVVSNGGTLVVASGGTLGDATIVGGGIVSLSAGAVDTATMNFVGSDGTVALGGTGTLGATLAGFAVGDKLDLTALPYAAGGTATLSGLLLAVTEGGATEKIAFAPGTDFSATSVSLASGRHGGTVLTLVSSGGSVQLLPGHLGSG